MKILIFTAKYGNGHLQVSKTLHDMLNRNIDLDANSDIENYEPYEQTLKPLDKFIDITYNKIFLPNSHKLLYRQIYDKSCLIFGSRINMFATRTSLVPFIRYIFLIQKPDVIIQTFPFNSLYKPDIPNIVFITDYGVHNFWVDKKADHFFVATDYTKDILIQKGVSQNQITVSGIPINTSFHLQNDSTKVSSILLTFGASGIKFNKKFIKQIKNLHEEDIKISIICGKNKKLYSKLITSFDNFSNIEIYGYVNNMHELVASHDLLITKPGGITLTEAIYSETPVIINKQLSVLGQEKYNINFIKDCNIGLLSTNKSIINDTITLINNDSLYQEMIKNMKTLKIDNQHTIITDQVNKIIKEYKNFWN